ncbi:hypothetical protein AC1031_006811 [Aphanomyces cochlioides]|nr:hypothetical protein AC1031_006811 [Aphanomyces cochlioides]
MEQAASSDHRSLCRQTDIQDKFDDIDEIVQEAVAEAAISKNLQETIELWETKELPFSYWTDNESRDIAVLGDTTECVNVENLDNPCLKFLSATISTIMNYNIEAKHFVTVNEREYTIDTGSMIIGFANALTLSRKINLIWKEMQGVLTGSRTSFQEEYLFTLSTAKRLAKRIVILHQKDSTSEEMECLKSALNEYFDTVLLSHQDIYEHAIVFPNSLWVVTDKDTFQNSSNQGNFSKRDETPRRMFHTYIRAAFNKLLLVPSESAVPFVSKMAAALAFHRCLILFRPQRSGKTTVARTLATALNDLF